MGADLQITEDASGRLVADRPLADTSAVVVDGVDYADDTLTVDFSGGLIPVPITDNGGIAGYDTLVIDGGHFKNTDYQAINRDSGTILLDSEVIHYTGLEPITDNSTVDDRVFNDTTAGPQTIELIDSGVAGYTKIDSPNHEFESVAFKNPANTLTINGATAATRSC